MTNSTDFSKLKPNQELYMIRYSQKEHPDFIKIKFKYFEMDTKSGEPEVEFTYKTHKGDISKVSNFRKSKYRIFLDIDEMTRSLYECFIKREIEMVDEYIELVENSQNNRPELWI